MLLQMYVTHRKMESNIFTALDYFYILSKITLDEASPFVEAVQLICRPVVNMYYYSNNIIL